jgi:hypothetical protein
MARTAPVVLTDLSTATANAVGAMASGTTLINGIAARLQAAVDAALDNGATAEELAPVQGEVDALTAGSADLAAAVAANPS